MDYVKARQHLVAQLALEITDTRTLAAINRVPRELFVPESLRQLAYEDEPLTIGFNQTISQPYIVALMTQNLEITSSSKVLELGTGSGYQTAILAELAREVHSTERIPELQAKAAVLLSELGYKNIRLHPAAGTLGWPPDAPYDAIITTAAAPSVPAELIDQLAPGGNMVIPVGGRWEQRLLKITKIPQGLKTVDLGGCRFVSLIGKGAWEPENT